MALAHLERNSEGACLTMTFISRRMNVKNYDMTYFRSLEKNLAYENNEKSLKSGESSESHLRERCFP